METTTFGTIRIDGLRGREFIIPYYQRGYKWRQDDVRLLVDDICDYTGSQPYYLQPLVVVQAGRPGRFLLVDGQQRLTTLYLILKTAQHKGLCPPQELYRFTCTAQKRQPGLPRPLPPRRGRAERRATYTTTKKPAATWRGWTTGGCRPSSGSWRKA